MARDFEPEGPGGIMVCQTCGSMVANGWFAEHRTLHEAVAPIPLFKSTPATPAHAHETQEHADRERRDFAWLHHCGHLNHGYWHSRNSCGGCRFSVEHANEVEAHYRLVEVEGLSDEGQG
jgi:hypothetical protein